ncbi:SIR2 family protein [Carnobacterium sp. ISL-102]|uniref:SIR2 family protein n=1 Tax=Carnobacterium sp. ISL-102 TaxID=2819142 RepID=UPI001BE90D9C|nr:SIR2 family protein [Carnobacterium sp. ISL-102]MBT2733139.1 SIR2 family protein [Carnobacterium sp. ISL-102]
MAEKEIGENDLYHFQGIDNHLMGIENVEEQINQIGTFLKSSIRARNLSVFIGSGCSNPATPMMGTTMKEITLKKENDDIVKKIREYTGEEKIDKFVDIEGLLNWLQNGINFEKSEVKKNELIIIFNKIKEEFISTIPSWEDEKYIDSSTIDTYTQFYKYIYNSRSIDSSKLSVFTTNYDLFNEFALENNSFSYTTGFTTELRQSFDINRFKYRLVDDTERYKDKWQPVKKEANLYKIHGSINWFQDENEMLCQSNYAKDKIVIYPTMLKHQETVQSPYSELFREFSTALQKPNTTLIVMGYGFPDEHINNIISQNIQNQDFNLIVFGDMSEDKMKAFYQKFNKKRNVHVIGGGMRDGRKGHYFNVITNEYLRKEMLDEKGDEDA